MEDTSTASGPAAGWYPDPDPGHPSLLRFWDGARWADQWRPATPTAAPLPPGPTGPRRNARLLIAVALVAIVALVALAGVLSSDDGSGSTTTPTLGPTTPADTVTAPEPAPGGSVTTESLLAMIGHDASDEEMRALSASCGRNTDQLGNLECPGQGFEITLDTTLTATRVILYPYREDSTAEFQGALPGRISWSDSYPDIVAQLGEPVEMEGGWGAIDLTAHYVIDGYDVGYGLDTWYNSADYLNQAHLTSITIRPQS